MIGRRGLAQPGKVLAIEPEDLNYIPIIYTEERENQVGQVVL